jgi:hypothetical protein
MDPKMDSGYLKPNETLDDEYHIMKVLSPDQILSIIDQLLCHEVGLASILALKLAHKSRRWHGIWDTLYHKRSLPLITLIIFSFHHQKIFKKPDSGEGGIGRDQTLRILCCPKSYGAVAWQS